MTNSNRINVFLIIVLAVLLYIMLAKKCNGDVVPVVKPSTEIIQEQVDLTAITKRIADSFNLEIQQKDREIEQRKSEYDNLLTEYLNEQNDISATLAKPVPDTCKPIVTVLTRQFDALKKTSANKDNTAQRLITSLRQQGKTKDKFLSAKDTAIKKYITLLDTCTKGYQQLEKSVKKLQPRSEVYVGVSMLGYPNKILNGYGVSLGLRNKQGTQFEINAININNTINYGLSIKKRLFKL